MKKVVDNKDFEKIGFVPGYGTTTESKSYHTQHQTTQLHKQYYRLKQIDFDGTFDYSSTVEVKGYCSN